MSGQGEHSTSWALMVLPKNVPVSTNASFLDKMNEGRFRSILRSVDEIVFSTPIDLREPTYVSPIAEKILGRPLPEIIKKGQFCVEFVHPEDVAIFLKFKKDVFGNGYAQLDYRIIRADGQIRWLLHRARLIRDDEGGIIRVDGTAMDITERKKTERELIEAREMADAANRDKSAFLAMMSHEIRTPLQSIFGYTELLYNTALTEQQHQYVRIIHSQAQALLNILNDILDFSKLKSGRLELEAVPFTLVDAFRDISQALIPEVTRKGLELKFHVDHRVPSLIISDPMRLRQILTNLINNAVKFTHRGGIYLEVNPLEERDAEEISKLSEIDLHFQVRDTGIGIPKDKIGRLFEFFSQADSSVSRKYGGTGLGLAISKQLCDLMGGRIWVESIENQGTTFHFTIKVKLPPSFVTAISSNTIEHHIPAAISINSNMGAQYPLKIMVVEDNPIALEMALHLLKTMGYHPTGASNGLEALQKLETEAYDAILMDVQMPNLDGLETTRLIREKFLPKKCPRIIAMTANVIEGDREKCFQAGMHDFISKPVTIENLQNALKQAAFRQKTVEDSTRDVYANPPSTLDATVIAKLNKMRDAEGGNLLVRLHHLFITETPAIIQSVNRYIREKKIKELEHPAHTLKGSCHVIGASKMADICQRLIAKSRIGEYEEIETLAFQLEKEFQQVCRRLEQELKLMQGIRSEE